MAAKKKKLATEGDPADQRRIQWVKILLLAALALFMGW